MKSHIHLFRNCSFVNDILLECVAKGTLQSWDFVPGLIAITDDSEPGARPYKYTSELGAGYPVHGHDLYTRGLPSTVSSQGFHNQKDSKIL